MEFSEPTDETDMLNKIEFIDGSPSIGTILPPNQTKNILIGKIFVTVL